MVRLAMASPDFSLATAKPSLAYHRGVPLGDRRAANLQAVAFALAVHLGAGLLFLFTAQTPPQIWRVNRATELTIVRLTSLRPKVAKRAGVTPSPVGAFHALLPPAPLPPSFAPAGAPVMSPLAGRADRPLAALRESNLGCALVGGPFADRALEQRCAGALGRHLGEAAAIDGLSPAKRAAFDIVAFEQQEQRAFFHLPTASTQYPHGAGGIASGPGSSEIFAHNVGDPSPPKDPLLLRQSRSLGPPVP